MPSAIIIDGNSLVYRSYHAFKRRPLTSASGFPTSAIHGFGHILSSLLSRYQPQLTAVAFDAAKKNFRHELYEEYKAGRDATPEDLVVQFPVIRELLEALGIPAIEAEGYEADDILATLAAQLEDSWNELQNEIYIVSGDRDMFQAISRHIKVLYPARKGSNFEIYDLKRLQQEYGITPDLFPDMKGLAGDKSDNIPGVPDIGSVTALKLIREYGNLENLYEHLHELPGSKRLNNLATNREKAFLSRQLALLCRSAPVDISLLSASAERDEKALARLISQYNLRTLADKFGLDLEIASDLNLQGSTGAEDKSNNNISPESLSAGDSTEYAAIFSESELNRVIEAVRRANRVSIDTETTSPSPTNASLVGISLSWQPGKSVYIPVGHIGLFEQKQLPENLVIDKLRPILTDSSIPKYGHNIKYDHIIFRKSGVIMQGIAFDTMLASYVLEPEEFRRHNLDETALRYLNYRCIPFSEIVPKGSTFADISIDQATTYSCEDADITLQLAECLQPQIADSGLAELYYNIELPLITVLADMEYNGICVDQSMLRNMSVELTELSRDVEDKIHAEAGVEFNINSPRQLSEVLFEHLGIPAKKKIKSGYSTNHQVLSDLAKKYPIAGLVLNYRSIVKLKNTYVDALMRLKNPATGRVHTSFNQTVTATGRLSSSEPNLQNIPARQELGRLIRKAFVAEEGHFLLSADYSQIELRLLAHFSNDHTLKKAFEDGQDIHARTASELFGINLEDVTREQRNTAKTINFGVIYGMNAFKLSNELGIDISQAAEYIRLFFERLPGVAEFRDHTISAARKNEFVTTIMGRRRYIPDINSRNGNLRQAAERAALNSVIQGSAADLIKMAMINIHRMLQNEALKTRLLLQIHDELVFEMPTAEADQAAILSDIMENAMKCSVNFEINLKKGYNLGDMEEFRLMAAQEFSEN